MADRVERGFLSVLQDAVVALGVDIAFKKFTAVAMHNGAKKFSEKVLQDKRAEILEDFRKMQDEGKKDRKNIDPLLRRHKEAINNFTENRFVYLLCKIPLDAKVGRRPTLWWLNDMTDERFNQMLCLLDHDVVLQWIERMRRRGGRIVAKDINNLRASLNYVTNGIAQAFRRLNQAAERQAPNLRRIADRLAAARTGGKS